MLVPMKIKHAVAVALLALTPALTGCIRYHTRSVIKTHPPEIVLNSTLDQLLQQLNARNAALQSMTLYVQIQISTTDSLQGVVKDWHALDGNVIIGNPDKIRVLLQVPVARSRALDMTSDGKSFKMLVPPYSCAITGSDVVTNSAQKGIYGLRPAVILDSMLIQGFSKEDLVSMTQDSRTFPDPKKKKELIEEPDYDIEFLSNPQGNVASTLRVLHVSRADLLPYRQDIYNTEGKVVTQALYSGYKSYGDIVFPTKIVIQRPLDELGLTITITKAIFNQKLDAEQFDLGPIPASFKLQNMDDPVSASANPCASHEPQSTH
jgi:hypothetical protein